MLLLSVRAAVVLIIPRIRLGSVILGIVVLRGGKTAKVGLRLLLWLVSVSILVVAWLRLVAKGIVMGLWRLRCIVLHLLHALHLWLAIAGVLVVALVHLLLLWCALRG